LDWLSRMNEVIRFIEDKITEDIDYDELSRLACCSTYHFQRMFSFITDIALSDYIRRRRLTLAAYELQNSDIRIIDIAMKYGYDSHEAFTRAFQKAHGIAPSLARNKGVILKAYPRISFQITIKGDVEMDYRIEEVSSSKVFGVSINVAPWDVHQYKEIEEFVSESWKNGLRDKIREAAGYGPEANESTKLLGTAVYGFKNDGSFRFMLTAEYPDTGVSDGFEVLDIPQATWAIFSTSCSEDEELDTISKIWNRLPEWFLATGYENRPDVAELEKCYRVDGGYLAEVWVPINNSKRI
jgi:AraC family transcriptional regulator